MKFLADYDFLTAKNNVRFYYFCLLYFAFQALTISTYSSKEPILLLWPVFWISFFDFHTAFTIIILFYLFAALLAALFPQKRLFRILICIGLFEYIAYMNSFGKIDHPWHTWVLTSFLLIFLPSFSQSKLDRQKFLLVFWGCQAVVLLTYTMSGFSRIYGAVIQIFSGHPHAFVPEAFAFYIANRLVQTNTTTLLGRFIVENPIVGWFPFVMGLYLELFALWAAIRPSLQKFWGFYLILFHIITYLTMGIKFVPPVLLLSLLFLNSPYKKTALLQTFLSDLPLFGYFFTSNRFPSLRKSFS